MAKDYVRASVASYLSQVPSIPSLPSTISSSAHDRNRALRTPLTPEQRRAALRLRIADSFERPPQFRYVGPIAEGNHGGTLLFNEYFVPYSSSSSSSISPSSDGDENDDDDDRRIKRMGRRRRRRRRIFDDQGNRRLRRKLVVKYSLDPDEDAMLHNEIEALELMRGAEHVGQILTPAGFRMAWPARTRGRGSGSGSPRSASVADGGNDQRGGGGGGGLIPSSSTDFDFLSDRPTFVMEFLEHGTMAQFKDRVLAHPDHNRVPNRILWRIALCLGRSLAAMVNAPQGPPNAPVVREEMDNATEVSNVNQQSPHLENLLMGNVAFTDTEHREFPIVKLIDFGRCDFSITALFSVIVNVWGAGKLLEQIACLQVSRELSGDQVYVAYNTGPIVRDDVTRVRSQVKRVTIVDGGIDMDLRMLLLRSMVDHRVFDEEIIFPGEWLDLCKEAVEERDEEYYRTNHPARAYLETDEYCRKFVQDIIREPFRGEDGMQYEEDFGAVIDQLAERAAAGAEPLDEFLKRSLVLGANPITYAEYSPSPSDPPPPEVDVHDEP
ncbi:hypothetical protein F4778DRAFT_560524 [Xylariomycetidae sp. FL2044]|nr:hypothetical protein F4778DRAFT_560524 [Xylariomycetidae sp. FL2044]